MVLKKGATRKKKATAAAATTIPELKRSFDALEGEVAEILKSVPPRQQVKRFQEVWRRIFGRPVDAAAAEAYLKVKAKRGGATRRSKKQGGGGMALAGAPLDFQTRPGVDGVYGSFPQYVSQGLSFYNTVNQQGLFKGCGTENITPKIAADMGSNQAGGGAAAARKKQEGGGVLTDLFSAKFVGSETPPSFVQDLKTMWEGRDVGASPSPDQNRLRFV